MKLKYGIDLTLIVGSLIILVFLVGYTNPLVVAPLDDYGSSEGKVLFEIEKADKLLIDDNMDFSTPEEYDIVEGLRISLEPGQYYWKVGLVDGSIKTLTINSEIVLELRKSEEGYDVVNVGNSRLNVDVYNGTELINKIKIESDGDKK